MSTKQLVTEAIGKGITERNAISSYIKTKYGITANTSTIGVYLSQHNKRKPAEKPIETQNISLNELTQTVRKIRNAVRKVGTLAEVNKAVEIVDHLRFELGVGQNQDAIEAVNLLNALIEEEEPIISVA